MTFLMGLNESYASIRAQILLMKPMPDITEVFSLLIQEERQRLAGKNLQTIDPIALMANVSRRPSTGPSNQNHFRRKESQRPICSHCKIKGHVVDRCYKLHGYPPGYKPRSEQPLTQGKPVFAATVSLPEFLENLTPNQCSHLMSFLQGHLQSANNEPITAATAISHFLQVFVLLFLKLIPRNQMFGL